MHENVPSHTMSERLPRCTVFQAELRAIQMACENIDLNDNTARAVHIHVDSQAALYALTTPYITSQTVLNTIGKLSNLTKTHKVSLQWVKAHIGIPGNELADEAAKAGSRSDRLSEVELPKSRTELNSFIKEARNLTWQHEWQENIDLYKQTKRFIPIPNPGIWKDIKALPDLTPTRLSRIARFLTGHAHMNRHSTIVKRGYANRHHQDSMCRLCEEGPESPIHLITECPVLNRDRFELLWQWQLDEVPEWSTKVIHFLELPIITELEERNPDPDV